MIKKWIYGLFIGFTFIFILAVPNKVSAREELSSVDATLLSGEVVGSIHLYDDYSVKFLYKYRLKDVSVNICNNQNCIDVAPKGQTYLNSEPYEEMAIWERSLEEYIIKKEVATEYVITISGDFKVSATATSGKIITLNKTISLDPIVDDDNDRQEEEVLDSLEKVKDICNKWIIPGLYIILATWLIVKGILLSIDIIKYSDNSEIRRQKLKAFSFLAIALICIAALNTGVGFLTGLFG